MYGYALFSTFTFYVCDVNVLDIQNRSAKIKKEELSAVKNTTLSHVIRKYHAYTVDRNI